MQLRRVQSTPDKQEVCIEISIGHNTCSRGSTTRWESTKFKLHKGRIVCQIVLWSRKVLHHWMPYEWICFGHKTQLITLKLYGGALLSVNQIKKANQHFHRSGDIVDYADDIIFILTKIRWPLYWSRMSDLDIVIFHIIYHICVKRLMRFDRENGSTYGTTCFGSVFTTFFQHLSYQWVTYNLIYSTLDDKHCQMLSWSQCGCTVIWWYDNYADME